MDIILGKVALTMEGTWAAHNSYPKLSYVTHEGDGWISRKASINVEPGTNDTVWRKATDVQPYIEAMQSATDAAVATNTAIIDAEQLRAQAENARVIAELLRESEEADREADERDRAAAEHERETAEAARDAAEDAREAAESAREAAEATRESNTDAALENVSTAIAAAGAATSAADTAAGSANTAADAAESAAGSADTAAAAATTAAGTATSAAAAATAAATEAKKLPYIDETTKTWMVYNASTHEYEDSEVAADDANKADKVTTATAGHIATLTAGGNLADGGVAASDLARRDGYYEGMGVGTADNLAGRADDAVPAEIVFRPSGGTADISDGTATIKEIEGKTILLNQYLQPLSTGVPSTYWKTVETEDVTLSGNTLTFTATSRYGRIAYIGDKHIITDHIVLVSAEIYADCDYARLYTGHYPVKHSNSIGWERLSIIDKANSFEVRDYRTEGWTPISIRHPMWIDLTKMFGEGNEPSTVEEFEALFQQTYYAYNAGTLLSLNATAIQSVGFNAFDLATETAHVVGGMEYEVVGAYTSLTLDGETVTPDADDKFTPSHSGTLTVVGGDNTTCIHLVHSGYRDGEYEEHWSFTRALNLDAFGGSMKSVGDVHDTMTAMQDIQRIGEREYQAGDEDDPAVLTDGTTTQYVLDEPVVTDYDEPRNLSYRVSDFGTEAILPQGVDEDGVPASAPLMADIAYGLNAVDTLRNLPKNYISKASFDDFCAKLGTAIGATITATFDGSKYSYTITSNTPEL